MGYVEERISFPPERSDGGAVAASFFGGFRMAADDGEFAFHSPHQPMEIFGSGLIANSSSAMVRPFHDA